MYLILFSKDIKLLVQFQESNWINCLLYTSHLVSYLSKINNARSKPVKIRFIVTNQILYLWAKALNLT